MMVTLDNSHLLLSPDSEIEIAGGGIPIEPIDISSPSHTVDELDEKRENERVYDYLCRLYEVRNWLTDCLHTNNICDENQLEENLSNGVLLARLAYSFAPHMVPLSKIFDFDEARYKRDGQPCYRHTDNIVLWKDALRSVHFPEILIPDTVDIYEGRNVKTIFSLYALAKHLYRIRRGPQIRHEDNSSLHFSPTLIDDARERLKESDLSMFGNMDDILATTPGNIDAHIKAIIELNNNVDLKDKLLAYLQNNNSGILHVSNSLIDEYQSELSKHKKCLESGALLNREQVQTVINDVNNQRSLHYLEQLLLAEYQQPDSDLIQINAIFDNLRQVNVRENAIPIYTEHLRATRQRQSMPLTYEQVTLIVETVNICMRLRHYVFEQDEDGIYEAIANKTLGLRSTPKVELKRAYKNEFLKTYERHGTDFVLMPEVIDEIVADVNCLGDSNFSQVHSIKQTCQQNDYAKLLELLTTYKITNIRGQLIDQYLDALKNSNHYQTMEDVQQIVRNTNATAERDSQLLHMIASCCEADDRIKLIELLAANFNDLNVEFVGYYLKSLKNEEFDVPKDVQEIIYRVNASMKANSMIVNKIVLACERNDQLALADAFVGMTQVNPELLPQYLDALKKRHYTTVDNVQEIIAQVNNDTVNRVKQKAVHDVSLACDANDSNKLAVALFKVDGVQSELMPHYLKALRDSPNYKTIEEIKKIVIEVNETFDETRRRVRDVSEACDANDLNKLVVALSKVDGVRKELMPNYLKALRDLLNYATMEEIEEIVIEVNETFDETRRRVASIKSACVNNDSNALAKALDGGKNYTKEYLIYYLPAFCHANVNTANDIDQLNKQVDNAVAEACLQAQQTLKLNRALADGKNDKATELLKIFWRNVVSDKLLKKYIKILQQEIVNRQNKLIKAGVKLDRTKSEYLPELFKYGQIYINTADETIAYQNIKPICEWMLTRDQIEDMIEKLHKNNNDGQGEAAKLDDKDAAEQAATKIQQWYRMQMFYKDLDELKTSEKPRIRVVRRFVPMLVSTEQDKNEEIAIEKDQMYATKLFNSNRNTDKHLNEFNDKMDSSFKGPVAPTQDLLKKIEKLEAEFGQSLSQKLSVRKDPSKWNPFEIIIYYLQTNPELLSRLMIKHSEKFNFLPDFFYRSILPIFNYGMSKREMSLLATLIRTYLKLELAKASDLNVFQKSQSSTMLGILMQTFKNGVDIRSQIAELNRTLSKKDNQLAQFNLNPESIYKSIIGSRAKSIDEAMSFATTKAVLSDSKDFLSKWSLVYANAIYNSTNKLPEIIRYIAASLNSDIKQRFPSMSNDVILQAIGAWLYRGCYDGVVISAEKPEAHEHIELRRVISKFIEFGILNYGYSVEKYWLHSLNTTITNISNLSMNYLSNKVIKGAPDYKYVGNDHDDQPVLHLSVSQLNVTQRRIKYNVDEMVTDRSSRLRRLIEDTMPPEEHERFITLYLHPFTPADSDQSYELFNRTKRYVKQCLLSGCPGENLTLMLARHTSQKEEEIFKNLSHEPDDMSTLDESKKMIVQNLSRLEKMGKVNARDNYQAIVTALAKDALNKHNYRKRRRHQLASIRDVILQLEKQKLNMCNKLNGYKLSLKKSLTKSNK